MVARVQEELLHSLLLGSSYSAQSYHDLTQGIEDLNLHCSNIEQSTQEIQTTLNMHIDNTTQQHE